MDNIINPKRVLLLFFLACFGLTTISAQVTFDNNTVTESSSVFFGPFPEISGFTAPAGTDRLLVVAYTSSNSANDYSALQISYGATNLQLGVEETGFNNVVIYYAILGSGAAMTDNITISSGGSGGPFQQELTAFTLQNVDQASPVESTISHMQPFGSALLNSLTLPGTTSGSMIIESQYTVSTHPVPLFGQTLISNDVDYVHQTLSFLPTPGGDIDATWSPNISPIYTAISFKAAVPETPIPTMGQWSLFILGLLLLNLGLIHVRQRELV